MTKLIGPYPFMLEGDPLLSVEWIAHQGRVRIVIDHDCSDGSDAISVSFKCSDYQRIIRAVQVFNDEMQRVETREAAE